MAIEFDGFDDLISTMEELGDIGTKVGKKGVKKALESALPTIKAEAPKDTDGTSHGADSLALGTIKSYKSGSTWGGAGINSKNWEQCKQLYFQHYGYHFYKNGKLVDIHKNWMDKAIEKSAPKAMAVLESALEEELNKILK